MIQTRSWYAQNYYNLTIVDVLPTLVNESKQNLYKEV